MASVSFDEIKPAQKSRRPRSEISLERIKRFASLSTSALGKLRAVFIRFIMMVMLIFGHFLVSLPILNSKPASRLEILWSGEVGCARIIQVACVECVHVSLECLWECTCVLPHEREPNTGKYCRTR